MSEAARRLAYEEWVRAHATELYRCAYRLTGKSQAAEDLVQDTFMEAWRCTEKLRDATKARAWLFQILRYRHLHGVRDHKRRMEGQPGKVPLAREIAAPREPAELDQRDTIQAGLSALDERLRETFLVVVMDGLTAREAAESLGVPIGTILSRLHRARDQLRATFSQNPLGMEGLHE